MVTPKLARALVLATASTMVTGCRTPEPSSSTSLVNSPPRTAPTRTTSCCRWLAVQLQTVGFLPRPTNVRPLHPAVARQFVHKATRPDARRARALRRMVQAVMKLNPDTTGFPEVWTTTDRRIIESIDEQDAVRGRFLVEGRDTYWLLACASGKEAILIRYKIRKLNGHWIPAPPQLEPVNPLRFEGG